MPVGRTLPLTDAGGERMVLQIAHQVVRSADFRALRQDRRAIRIVFE
jgi:hypothetical protein